MTVSLWQTAMVCLLPFMAAGSPVRFWGIGLPYGRKLKTWAVLIGVALVSSFMPAAEQWTIMARAFLCLIGGLLLIPRPRSEAQLAIGLIFVVMALVHIGFYVACRMQPGPHDYYGYASFNRLLGWLQWACLAYWGAGDAIRGLLGRRSDLGSRVAAREGF